MKRIVLSDLDCVVADFWTPALRLINIDHHRNNPRARAFTIDDVTDWDITGTLNCRPVWDSPGFFSSLELLPGAAEGLESLLSEGHEVFIVSAGNGLALGEKSAWLRKHLPFMKGRAYFTDGKTPKGLLRGDVLIDDGPHNLIDFKARNPSGIAIAAHYRYTEPADTAADYIVPFAGTDSRDSWRRIVSFIGASS